VVSTPFIKNGFAVTSQLDKIVFSTRVSEQSVKFEEIAAMVKKYVTLVPHVEYTGLGINQTFIFSNIMS
jgi:hypothetical protein